MARVEVDPNYTAPTFSRATAGTDLFKKEDVQALAAAVSTHDHTTGKGAALVAGSIPAGSITSGMIADATIDTADLKDGSVTSAKIADGTIATADLANGAVTNAKLAADTARANLLVNGGFEIWQRGAGPFTTGGGHSADRWILNPAGTDSLSVSRDTTNYDTGSYVCAAVTFTLGSGGGASGLHQAINAVDGIQFRARTLSWSARVKTTVANAVRLGAYDGTAWTYGAYHPGGGVYQTLTVTWTVGASATLANVSLFFSASCTAYVDNGMLVVGGVPAEYAPLHPADDLARCLRYYEIIGETTNTVFLTGSPGAGNAFYNSIYYKARKAVVPTTTKVGTWTTSNTTGQPAVNVMGVDASRVDLTATAAGYAYAQNVTAGNFISIESNP